MNVARQPSLGAFRRSLEAAVFAGVMMTASCSDGRLDDLLDRRTTTTVVGTTVPVTNVPVTVEPLRTAVTPLRINAHVGHDEGTLVINAVDVCQAGIAVVEGYLVDDCVVAETLAGPLTAMSLRNESDGRWKVVIFDRIAGGWASSYLANEPNVGEWDDVGFLIGDFEEPVNGGAELWIGYRYAGERRTLDLDLVDRRSPELTILGTLRDLRAGAVVVAPGGVAIYEGDGSPTDPACCPSVARTFSVTFNAVNWIASAETAALTADVPIPDSAL